ncbi:hypothetical protein VN97_g9146 [Penicillium thymicola]|uniref:Uncharacterized protein n=1 Tax=Penicillium thymicola TaxID=293382 RepID=A0AAI9TC47_PENTH|nr:hypothetical protein VN97_g9146 [Penicillium thymicola]
MSPPNETRLTDKGVYMTTNYLQATELASRWPVDFDRNGHIHATRIHATRTPEDPAPMTYAYGLPVFIARGETPLIGRADAGKLGHMTLKIDESIKNTLAFSVGSSPRLSLL